MKYFTIPELCRSKVAERLGIDNRCKKEHVVNMQALIDKILDPLREAYGKPITVNSGFRCPALNKAVGGSPTSDHPNGEASDITGGSKDENRKLFELAQKLNLPFDQLINEKDFSWIHISHKAKRNRHQVLAL
jgi:hypothetical protein